MRDMQAKRRRSEIPTASLVLRNGEDPAGGSASCRQTRSFPAVVRPTARRIYLAWTLRCRGLPGEVSTPLLFRNCPGLVTTGMGDEFGDAERYALIATLLG